MTVSVVMTGMAMAGITVGHMSAAINAMCFKISVNNVTTISVGYL